MSDVSQQIIDAFREWEVDDEKFDRGNHAAGTRARKNLLKMVKLAKLRRAEITEAKNASKEGT